MSFAVEVRIHLSRPAFCRKYCTDDGSRKTAETCALLFLASVIA